MKKLGPDAMRLLRTGDCFDPPPGARDRVARGVARRLMAAAAMASVVAKETLVAGMGTAAGGAGAASGVAWTAPFLKVVVGLAITGAVAAGGVSLARHGGATASSFAHAPAGLGASASTAALRPRELPPEPVDSAAVESVRRVPIDEPVSSAVESSVPTGEAPARFQERGAPVPVTTKPTAVPPSDSLMRATEPVAPPEESTETPRTPSSLAAETSLLRQAHVARMSGDAARSLTLLDEYAREWSRGVLQDEAAAERALALCALGRSDDARRAARPLLLVAPSSPLANRLRASCARDVP